MRLRLLTMSLVDKVMYALNMKANNKVTQEADVKRTALLGDDASIHEQTLRTRAFAEEVAAKVAG